MKDNYVYRDGVLLTRIGKEYIVLKEEDLIEQFSNNVVDDSINNFMSLSHGLKLKTYHEVQGYRIKSEGRKNVELFNTKFILKYKKEL